MALLSQQIPIGTSALALTASDGDGQSLAIKNAGTGSVYLGAENVSSANGFELAASQVLTVDLAPDEMIYAVSVSGTNTVQILKARA